jgi:hypothetical protein
MFDLKVRLNIVPGKEPIAKAEKYIPARVFPQKNIINNLHKKFANVRENDEKNGANLNLSSGRSKKE